MDVDREYRRHRRSAYAGIFIGYASYYLVRNTLALAIPDILQEYPQHSKADLGWALTGTLGSVRVLWGACDALFTPDPLGPLFDVADQTGGGLLAAVKAPGPRRELFSAFLEEIGKRPPTVAVVEAIHSADEATLDLLRFVARRVDRTPALVLVTYRDDELDPNHPLRALLGAVADLDVVRRLTLPPLSEEGVRALAPSVSRKTVLKSFWSDT